MEVTNAIIHNASEPLKKLLTVKLPMRTSLEIVKLAKAVREHADIIEQVRSKLIRDYGKPNPKQSGASTISPSDEGFPKFAEELGELLGQTVEIDFKVVRLPNNIEIEPYVLMALESFVEVEG